MNGGDGSDSMMISDQALCPQIAPIGVLKFITNARHFAPPLCFTANRQSAHLFRPRGTASPGLASVGKTAYKRPAAEGVRKAPRPQLHPRTEAAVYVACSTLCFARF